MQDLSSQSSMTYDDLSNMYEFKINVKVIWGRCFNRLLKVDINKYYIFKSNQIKMIYF
jgi:hypothetical protein